MTAQKVTASSGSGASRLAFSYQRVSSPKQTEEGRTGLSRQADAFLAFCQNHGLAPNSDPLVDRGVSAFHGRHRSKGALGAFIAAAEAGSIPPGTVLVVEDLDRFSRETASHAEGLLLALFGQQLALGIVRDNVVVDRARYDTDLGLRVMLLTRRDAAHDYSKKLSGRITDVWKRRQQAWQQHRRRYLGKGSRPFWLSDDGTDFTEIREAVDLVQRMYNLSTQENMGATQIAHLFNQEGIKAARGNAYGPTRITRILHDRRVLGEKEWSDGTTSAGYFPRIVDQALWDACQQAIERRHDNKGRHGRGQVIGNLFQGTTFCPCGQGMSLQPGRDRKGQVAYEYLRCLGRRKGTCTQPSGDWSYDEEALLMSFMAERWGKFLDRPVDNQKRRALQKQVRELETTHATQEQEAAKASNNMADLLKQGALDGPTASMLGKFISDAKAAAESTQRRIQALQADIQQLNLRPTGQQIQQQIRDRVQEFLDSGRHDVKQRRAFNNWLIGLGVRVTITDPKLGRLQWGANDVVIYRDHQDSIVSDETLGDMAAFGFNEADIAKREAEIRQEQLNK
jgi:DNA invertase Pin-like site-specific DNA recombinase